LFILGFIFIYIPSLPPEKVKEYQEKISNAVTDKMSKFVTPMVKSMTQDLIKDMNID
jgi:hypothetical protein